MSCTIAGLTPPLLGTGWQAFLHLLPWMARVRALLCFEAELGDGEEQRKSNEMFNQQNSVSSQAGLHLSRFLFSELLLTINPFSSPFIH